MKRDMDVIRQILLALDEDGVLLLTGVDGMDKDVFASTRNCYLKRA